MHGGPVISLPCSRAPITIATDISRPTTQWSIFAAAIYNFLPLRLNYRAIGTPETKTADETRQRGIPAIPEETS
jgi:hypothetical protein